MYLERNVFDAAIDRINLIYDAFDDAMVTLSGGKDSTVLFNLAYMVAKDRGRLPLKVFWLDQEVEWQHTVDYVSKIMHRPDVEPIWYQTPFKFPNNTSNIDEYVTIWDPTQEAKWIHPQDPIAYTHTDIKLKGSQDKDFYILMKEIPKRHITGNKLAILDGLRIDESPARRLAITAHAATFGKYTWANREDGNTQRFHPIYDFSVSDIWTSIAKNRWEYNPVYDLMYQYGVPKQRMRVSALTHETAYSSIKYLQEFEPKTYNRYVARMGGIQAANQTFSNLNEYIPTTLPFMFKDWKEYRDYLLEHIVKPEYQDIFRKRWEGQDDTYFYKVHVKEVIVNDTCGTINKDYVLSRGANEHWRDRKV